MTICCARFRNYLLPAVIKTVHAVFQMNQHTLEELKRAIERALESGDLFNPDGWKKCANVWSKCREQREQLIAPDAKA